MKIKRAIIVFIILTVVLMVLSRISQSWELLIIEEILGFLWILSQFWVIYEIIAQIVRSIYKAIKNWKAPQSKTPLEP